jgi:ABC-type Fe3+-hydroxamate transport system substrate-binding protein
MLLHDILGRAFSFDTPPQRVVSLVPSLTETLFDLGAGDSVAAITNYCIFPPGLERPRIGGTKNPDVDAIRELAPDLVYMNLEENLERQAKLIEQFAPVFVTEPKSIADVVALLTTLGAIHRCDERAATLVSELRHEINQEPQDLFTFACAIWKQPWKWCGGDTYLSNLVTAAGGMNILQETSRYPSIELETVVALKPNVIFLPDEPYAFTTDDAAEVERLSGARVIGPFPGHLFTWHGTRTIEGLRFLRTALSTSA